MKRLVLGLLIGLGPIVRVDDIVDMRQSTATSHDSLATQYLLDLRASA